jgi:putative oxidoreductase
MDNKEFREKALSFDKMMIDKMHAWGIPILRVSVAIIFLWYGILKCSGLSPVEALVRNTYGFMPYPAFFYVLAIFEIFIGLGLLFKIKLRLTLVLLWGQLLGTFFSFFLAPSTFLQSSNPLLLTMEGEFVMKNIVLFASGIVIGGYLLTPIKYEEEGHRVRVKID